MRKRLILNVALVLAVAGLSLLLWWNPGEQPPTPPITGLQPDAITQIKIDYPDAASLELAREDGQWRITAPVQARAENNEVVQILKLATRVPTRTYPASAVELGEVGLEPPAQTVTLNGQKIQLGGKDALENNRYARIGNQVFLIPAPLDTALDADYAELVAREILPEDSQLTRLELPEATLTPTEQGGWQITPAAQDKGADAAQYTIDAWTRASALWIKPADPEQAAKQEPGGQVRLHTEAGETFTLEVIAREPQLILRAPAIGVNYHMAANLAAPLLDLEHPETQTEPQLKSRPDVELAPDAEPEK